LARAARAAASASGATWPPAGGRSGSAPGSIAGAPSRGVAAGAGVSSELGVSSRVGVGSGSGAGIRARSGRCSGEAPHPDAGGPGRPGRMTGSGQVSSNAPCAVKADGGRLAGSRLGGTGGSGPGPDRAAPPLPRPGGGVSSAPYPAGAPVAYPGSGLAGNADSGDAAGTGREAVPDPGGTVRPGCCACAFLMSGDCAGAPWGAAPDSNQDRGRVAGSGRGIAPEAGRVSGRESLPGRGSLPGPGVYRGAGLVAPLRPAWPGGGAPGGTRWSASPFPDG